MACAGRARTPTLLRTPHELDDQVDEVELSLVSSSEPGDRPTLELDRGMRIVEWALVALCSIAVVLLRLLH